LTKNWPAFLLDQSSLPETVDEAIDRLLLVLDKNQQSSLAAMQEQDLVELHFTLGMSIRNAFKLHRPDSKLAKSCGASMHPDDISGLIIAKLWQRLQSSH
jgi:hypothetical protein